MVDGQTKKMDPKILGFLLNELQEFRLGSRFAGMVQVPYRTSTNPQNLYLGWKDSQGPHSGHYSCPQGLDDGKDKGQSFT